MISRWHDVGLVQPDSELGVLEQLRGSFLSELEVPSAWKHLDSPVMFALLKSFDSYNANLWVGFLFFERPALLLVSCVLTTRTGCQEPMVPRFFIVGRYSGRAGGTFLLTYNFTLVPEPAVRQIGGEAPRSQISHCFLGDIFWESQYPPAPEPTVQDLRPESVPGPSGSGEPPENGNGSSEDEGEEYGDYDDDLGTIVDLRGQVACFCRVGNCLYWHTDPKQVRRHWNTHFRDRFSYHCPNRTGTYPSELHKFSRRDGVNGHCKGSSVRMGGPGVGNLVA